MVVDEVNGDLGSIRADGCTCHRGSDDVEHDWPIDNNIRAIAGPYVVYTSSTPLLLRMWMLDHTQLAVYWHVPHAGHMPHVWVPPLLPCWCAWLVLLRVALLRR